MECYLDQLKRPIANKINSADRYAPADFVVEPVEKVNFGA
jgi:hypothetical protein